MDENEIILENDNGGEEEAKDLIKKLKEKLKKCEEEKAEYLSGWQRAKADFINARREEEELRKEIVKFSEKNLILDLLYLADSFDAFFRHQKDKKIKEEDEGIKNIYQQLMNIFKSRGVEPINCLGEKFNPSEHEAIEEVKVDEKEKDGIIIEEIRKGYKMHNKIIRASQVKVGKFNN